MLDNYYTTTLRNGTVPIYIYIYELRINDDDGGGCDDDDYVENAKHKSKEKRRGCVVIIKKGFVFFLFHPCILHLS